MLVPPGDVVRAGPGGLTGRVYSLTDKGWELSENRVTIPEGWYAVPPETAE